jgi:16S rRNA (cytidine1402-2'-O)-methyltransferase
LQRAGVAQAAERWPVVNTLSQSEPPPARAQGSLVLVPNTLDLATNSVDIREVLPDGVLRQAAALVHWVVEDARSARAFLKRVGAVHPLAQPLQAIDIRELPRPAKGGAARPVAGRPVESGTRSSVRGSAQPFPPGRLPGASVVSDPHGLIDLLAPARQGRDIGLLSEAGLPAVADPGALLVAAAHRVGISVRTLPGPSSLLLALAASGLDGQHFAFVGYLPQDAAARAARICELEALSRRLRQTQIAIETPYRTPALLQALLQTLASTTRLAVSQGLTLPTAFSRTDTVGGWRARPSALSDRTPAVFSWLG